MNQLNTNRDEADIVKNMSAEILATRV